GGGGGWSERGVAQRDLAHRVARLARISNIDSMAARSECQNISAGIDQPFSNLMAAQRLDSTIDRKSLRNAAKVDFHTAVGKADVIFWEQLDGVPRSDGHSELPTAAAASPGLRGESLPPT